MEKHITAKHKVQHQIVIAKKEEIKKRKAQEQLEKEEASKKPKTMVVEMDIDKVKEACVYAVTVDGLPFNALEGVGFRQLIDPYIKGSGSGKNEKLIVIIMQKCKTFKFDFDFIRRCDKLAEHTWRNP